MLATQPGHDPAQGRKRLEGILGVVHIAFVNLAEVILHIRPGQRSTTEHDRDVRLAQAVQLLQVLLHDHRGFHQQPGHADDVRVVLLGGCKDVADRLLDADIHHFITVIGEDDVHQVLADIVHIALHRGDHHLALGAGLPLSHRFHVWLQVSHRSLHGLG